MDRQAQHAGARDLNFNESISDRRVHPRYEPHSKKVRYLRPLSRRESSVHREQIDLECDGAVSQRVWRWLRGSVRYHAHGGSIYLSNTPSIAI